VGVSIVTAFALMLVIEGLMPLVSPQTWKETFRRILALTDGQIRFFGLVSIITGLAIFLLVSLL